MTVHDGLTLAVGKLHTAVAVETGDEDFLVTHAGVTERFWREHLLAPGTARQAAPGAVVGVHQHFFGKNTLLPAFMAVRDVQRAQASVMDYLDEMGVDLRMMSFALRTPPEEIHILDAEHLRDFNLVTDPDTA